MKMKKKVLSVAIVASMGMGSAHAVNLSQDGTGEVGLVPYYTVQESSDTANWETLISVVNTTMDVKAIKIRFREAMNSVEVYDFNLYLSPYDVWTGKVQQGEKGVPEIETNDKSCTVPVLTDGINDFLAFDIPANENATSERLWEGYIEVFEMAVVNDATMVSNITHVSGVPRNCSAVNNEFLDDTWNVAGDTEPTGGLKVSAALINVQDGSEIGMPVTHLEAFSNVANHRGTGTLAPTLANAAPPISLVAANSSAAGQAFLVFNDTWAANPVDAVTALLMTDAIKNEFTVNPATAATTDWVITFPTKREYVNAAVARAPFTNIWNSTGSNALTACESTTTAYWDREEQQVSSGILPSPQPADARLSLCWEANVVNIGSASDVVGSDNVDVSMDVSFNNGWVNIQFNEIGHVLSNAAGTVHYQGLPAIGFRATRLGNENVGVGAAYAVGDEHAYDRVITTTAGGGAQAVPPAGGLDTSADFAVSGS
jgi:hypothetical protein